jgi:hypothetical protein
LKSIEKSKLYQGIVHLAECGIVVGQLENQEVFTVISDFAEIN